MLSLQLKDGEYLTIGEDIVIQVFTNSTSTVRVAVQAPRDMTVLRGEVLERNGKDRPVCLFDQNDKKRGSKSHPGAKPINKISNG